MRSDEERVEPLARLGKVVLFGSGETSASGRAVHERLMAELPSPIIVAILETPAGFQPNSEYVARQVAEFITARLKNYSPQIRIIPARKRGTSFSPDDPRLLDPLLEANYIFLGPGSPTYAVRNLQNSLALRYILARHREGAILCFASAATLAAGAKVLPVYEIFKAGSDLYWADGLDIFGPFGLELAVVPHWNNTEGGAHLDTSRCFMGRQRFEELKQLLPSSTVVLGIDEHTAVIFDLRQGQGSVVGKGRITIDAGAGEQVYERDELFPLKQLGPYQVPAPSDSFDLPEPAEPRGEPAAVSAEVVHLISLREEARRVKDWARADAVRQELAAMGVEMQDTPDGPLWRYTGERGP